MSRDPLLNRPIEDAGAETLARYRYQHEVTSLSACEMWFEDKIKEIVCEWHEDYLVRYNDGSDVLVSVKHREPNRGPWTFAALFDAGGIRHLFKRWLDTHRQASCLLQTNAALNGEAADFKRSLPIKGPSAIADKAHSYLGPHGHLGDVDEFLGALSIEDELPHRTDIRSSNLQRLRENWGQADAEQFYELLLSKVASVCSSDFRSVSKGIRHLSNPSSPGPEHAELIQAKTLTRQIIIEALSGHLSTKDLNSRWSPESIIRRRPVMWPELFFVVTFTSKLQEHICRRESERNQIVYPNERMTTVEEVLGVFKSHLNRLEILIKRSGDFALRFNESKGNDLEEKQHLDSLGVDATNFADFYRQLLDWSDAIKRTNVDTKFVEFFDKFSEATNPTLAVFEKSHDDLTELVSRWETLEPSKISELLAPILSFEFDLDLDGVFEEFRGPYLQAVSSRREGKSVVSQQNESN